MSRFLTSLGSRSLITASYSFVAFETLDGQGVAKSSAPRRAHHHGGALIHEPSSSATDAQPRSFRVRTSSERRISIARATPASPPAARPYAYARPTSTALAPRQSAFPTCPPRGIPPAM